MSWFLVLKYIHILAAVTAVGFNISYTVWIVRAQLNPAHTEFALKGVKFLDDRVANPAYGLLLVTGILMVIVGQISFTTLWIDVALVLWVVLMGVGIFSYTPTLRDQIKLIAAGDTTSAEFERLQDRGRNLGIFLGVVVLVILGMMVFKPHL